MVTNELHLLSDLHLERAPYRISAGPDFDVLAAASDISDERMARYHDTTQQVIAEVTQSFSGFGSPLSPERHTLAEAVAAMPEGEGLEIDKLCGPVHFDFYEISQGWGTSRDELRQRFRRTVATVVAVEKAFRHVGLGKPLPAETKTPPRLNPERG